MVEDQRGRRRRRRRGRGGRSEGGNDAAASGNGNALTAERNDDEVKAPEPYADEPNLAEAQPVESVLVNEPLTEPVASALPSEPAHEAVVVSNITAVRVPPLVAAPTMIALPVVQPAPYR